jgi:hypothetical protein
LQGGHREPHPTKKQSDPGFFGFAMSSGDARFRLRAAEKARRAGSQACRKTGRRSIQTCSAIQTGNHAIQAANEHGSKNEFIDQ